MTNPVYFEDPRSLTEVRPIFANHRVPQSAGGGTIQVYAAQIRLALNECVSIIATKDGYIVSDHPLIHDGWADVSAGLKFNLYRDVEEQQLLAGGVVYEIPAGSHSAFQGNGDGEFHLFLTGGTELGTDWHLISGTGLRLAVDPTLQSNSWYWSNHLDRKLTDCLYALTELNWYHWFHSGNNPTTGVPGIEGGDFFNLGSPNVTGNNIVTMAWGGKYKPNENFELGVAYEVPLTKRKDVMEDRLTVDMIFRY